MRLPGGYHSSLNSIKNVNTRSNELLVFIILTKFTRAVIGAADDSEYAGVHGIYAPEAHAGNLHKGL